MNRYFVASGGLHLAGAFLLLLLLAPSAQKGQATYTIDFIGSGKVQAVTGQEPASSAIEAPKAAVQAPQEATPAPKEAPKASKKDYASKMEIADKPNPKKKAKKEVPLAAPSILNEEPALDTTTGSGSGATKEGEFEGGNIQTDFANFPYPWYITEVRNSLWIEWEKRRPAGSTLAALVTFSIARDGKIKHLKVERSSGDDSYDFAATSAIINAGPFAPLPMLFEKDELTVTVEFKQEK